MGAGARTTDVPVAAELAPGLTVHAHRFEAEARVQGDRRGIRQHDGRVGAMHVLAGQRRKQRRVQPRPDPRAWRSGCT